MPFATNGLSIPRRFTKPGVNPLDEVQWEKRASSIKNTDGTEVFEQRDVEVPTNWSQLATDIVVSKYFRKNGVGGEGKGETSVRQVVTRLSRTMRGWGEKDGYFRSEEDANAFEAELAYMLVHQYGAFNSPVWFNCGLYQEYAIEGSGGNYRWNPETGVSEKKKNAYENPQLGACFIISVSDSIESISEGIATEMRLFRHGSGSGANYSKLRGKQESLSGGGKSSGLISFLEVFDKSAGSLKSGGTCLAPDQRIYTEKGPRAVEYLAQQKETFIVLSFHPPTGNFKQKKATAKKSNHKNVVRVTTSKNEYLVSFDHPFRLPAGTYRAAGALESGDELFACRVEYHENGWYEGDSDIEPNTEISTEIVRSVEPIGSMDVYDVEVECSTLDDKSPETGHNFVLWNSDHLCGSGAVVANTRRAAKLVCVDADHPEIVDFVRWKANEEKKIRILLAAGIGLDAQGKPDFNGEAHRTVSGQNANNSVCVTDGFMRAVENDEEWHTVARTTGKIVDTYKARDLWKYICESAWECADPGLMFDTTMNKWHTVPNHGRINAANPCIEFQHSDNTACNLFCVNLIKFVQNDAIDIACLRFVCRIAFIAQEIIVSNASYPTAKIAENSYKLRPLGLGYSNLGTLLMILGFPYDSNESRTIAASLTAIMSAHAETVSAEMARVQGPFEHYEANKEPALAVTEMHRSATSDIPAIDGQLFSNLRKEAVHGWNIAVSDIQKHGLRNSQATLIMPAGCLVAGSLVATDKGLIRIDDIGNKEGSRWQDIDTLVQTDDGPKKANKFYINGNQSVIEVRTKNGYIIRGTANHKIKIVNENKDFEWRRFDELRSEDKIPLAMNQMIGERISVSLPECPPPYRCNKFRGIETPKKMNEELAELVGFFMANGSLHRKGLRLHIFEGDTDVVSLYRKFIKNQFNSNSTISEGEGCVALCLNSTQIMKWWKSAGFAKTKYEGDDKCTCRIPEAILSSNSKEIYGAFLRGLFTGDGGVCVGCPTFSNKDRKFISEVQTMLLCLGVPMKLKRDTGGMSGKDVWNMRVKSSMFNNNFKNSIGFSCKRKLDLVFESGAWSKADFIPLNGAQLSEICPIRHPNRKKAMIHIARHGGVARHMVESMMTGVVDYSIWRKLSFFYDEIKETELMGIEPTYDISVPDNVTYIANGFISHNTVGLLMDNSCTGVEPDFALVKHKKLAGGGSMKILNEAVPEALKNLGYTDAQIRDILTYALGTKKLTDDRDQLLAVLALALSPSTLEKSEAILHKVYAIDQALLRAITDEELTHHGITREKANENNFSFLQHVLHLSNDEMNAMNHRVLGHETVENAPHLKVEHYAVFDCASTCGDGTRVIEPMAHVKMVAAVQPFLSGSVSKTINCPNDTTPEQIGDLYMQAWKLGLKAISVYRDGCKSSQPLSTGAGKKYASNAPAPAPTLDAMLADMPEDAARALLAKIHTRFPALSPRVLKPTRRRLPNPRTGPTYEARVGNTKLFLRSGSYPDGSVGEIFIDTSKPGADYRALMNCFAISISKGLQYGVPLEVYVEQFTFTDFAPSGIVEGDANLKMATSVLDWVFRKLAIHHLGRNDLAHVPLDVERVDATAVTLPAPAQTSTRVMTVGHASVAHKLASNAGVWCASCGGACVRSGACAVCTNCGTTTGCS